ncbi:MAG: WYL domain-containing protein [Sphingomonadales bacterium]|nr:WYL domain-containing protein [Sphingomonadales bacterium]
MRWGVEQRLEFIEFRLFWEGEINRSDLVEQFGVSVPQASKDLSLYQERAPGNLRYDTRAKRYLAEPEFMLRFLDPDPDVYLSRLRSVTEGVVPVEDSWFGAMPLADAAITPRREVDIEVLRAILRAVREDRSVNVLYQSMNRVRPDPIWRRFTPHAFGYDGFRWHVRAYCHLEHCFKDFLLPRILEIGEFGASGESGAADWLWHNYFDIIIAPHPGLTPSQQMVVAKDYGLSDGTGAVSVRYAMLFYVLKKLNLLGNPEKEDPRRQHIVAVNKRAVQEALDKSNASQAVLLGDRVSNASGGK